MEPTPERYTSIEDMVAQTKSNWVFDLRRMGSTRLHIISPKPGREKHVASKDFPPQSHVNSSLTHDVKMKETRQIHFYL